MIVNIKSEKILNKKPRKNILGIEIDDLTMHETVTLVDKYITNHESLHLMGVNADKINETKVNPYMKKIVNSCGIINADGASVVLASKILKKPLVERVAGIDLMSELLKLSNEKKYSIFLLGAKEEVVLKTCDVIKKEFPNVNLIGYRNGYFKESEWEEIAINIGNLKPQIIFVGITSPLKEYIIEYMQNEGISSVFMGVGGSFDVLSGNIPRAPKWMQNNNLEWLFRVYQEPKRLLKRYFIGNIIFIKHVLSAKFKGDK